MLKRSIFITVMLLVLAATRANALPISFSIDTSGLQNQTALLTFDLLDSAVSHSNALVSSFQSDAVLSGPSTIIGDASGVLPAVVTLGDSSFFNEYSIGLSLGTNLQFDINFSGVGPSGSELPDAFSTFLINPASSLPLFATTDPTGSDALLLYNFGGRNTLTDLSVYSSTVTANIATVPEPSSFWLLGGGILAVLIYSSITRTTNLRFLRRGWRHFLIVTLSVVVVIMPRPALATSVAGWTDLATSISIQASGLVFNRHTNTYDSTLTVNNRSNQAIAYPIVIVLQGLSTNASLSNAFAISSEGYPFLLAGGVGTTLAPNTSVSTVLKFANRSSQKFTFSYRVLSPPTSSANQLLVGGPDSNNNGIRDDVEGAIRVRYVGFPNKIGAGLQLTREMRNMLINQTTTEQVHAEVLELNKAFECMHITFGIDVDQEVNTLRRLVIDTRPRVEAWIAAQNILTGQSAPIHFQNACVGLQ